MPIDTLADLRRFIQADARLERLHALVEGRVRAQPGDPGHELSHFLRVALWTLLIGEGEGEIDPVESVAAALLHDIVNVPKNSPLRKEASRLCAEEAQVILPPLGFSGDAVQRISEAIRCHSFSRGEKPVAPLAKALQDADRLEALGSIGIMRCVSTGTKMGTSYFDPSDPWARERPLDDARYSIDHFFTKLLKLPETMTTDAGRKEAVRRAETLEIFLSRLGEELGEPLERA